MKKLLVLLVAAVYCLAGIAAEPSSSWILSNAGKMNMKKINLGVFKAKIVLENGKKLTIPIDQLNTYSVNGKVFNKLPLYKNGKATGHNKFMELLKINGELSLYKTTIFNDDLGTAVDVYNVYKGEDLYLALDNKSMPSVLNFFSVKWEYK